MSNVQAAYTLASIVALAAVLLGLYLRRLLRASYAWDAYLASVLVTELVIFALPQRFYTWTFWYSKELLFALLKLGMAVELGWLTLGGFPGGRRRAQQWTLAILSATCVGMALPVPQGRVASLALEIQSRLANATAILFATIWLLVLYYNVPLHRIHRAILAGLSLYLVVPALASRALGSLGDTALPFARYFDSTAYVTLCLFWTWEAWRRVPDPAYPDALAPYLKWRARL